MDDADTRKPLTTSEPQSRLRADVPAHVAIIMDGNGRWAAQRSLPRFEGHRRGVEALRRTVRAAIDLGIAYLTVYSFSSENWSRPKDEVRGLMGLLKRFIRNDLADLHANNVRIRVIGDRSGLPSDIGPLLVEAEEVTRANTGLTLVIAFNYGGRQEIVAAARALAVEAAAGRIDPQTIDADVFERRLGTFGIPDPDLVVRTSGEQRLSNFLPWQAAYAEFVFLPVLWPDFDRASLEEAIVEFARRERRFGGIGPVVAQKDGLVTVPHEAAAAAAPPQKSGGFADLKTRVLSAVVMAVLAVGTLVAGGVAFTLFWLAAGVAICWEWQTLIGGGGRRARFYVTAASVAVACAFGAELWPEAGLAVLLCGALAAALLADRGLKLWAAAGALYAGVLVLALCVIKPPLTTFGLATRFDPAASTRAIVWLFAVVWGTDVMAYFGGRLIGGPKLWRRVSAGKTWSGTLVGVASGALLGLAVAAFRSETPVAIAPMLLIGLCAAALAQVGDLLESSIKRRFGVKDSSNLIPGHGGVMDRLDGFITAAVFAAALGAAHSWPSVAEGLFQWR